MAAMENLCFLNSKELLDLLAVLVTLIAVYFAYQANGIARNSAKHQLRAYISIEEIKLDSLDKFTKITFFISNSGETPAGKVKVTTAYSRDEIDDPDQEHKYGLLDPRAKFIGVIRPVSTNGLEPIKVKNNTNVSFTVEYVDIYGNHYKRFAKYYLNKDVMGQDYQLSLAGSSSYEIRIGHYRDPEVVTALVRMKRRIQRRWSPLPRE